MKPLHLLAAAAALTAAIACEDFLREFPSSGRTGTLSWTFPAPTRAAEEYPDTNRFLLSVTDAGGKSLYNGLYGDSPETLEVGEGSYTVSVRSCEWEAPTFDSPLYGDTQVVQVRAGRTTRVTLECTMLCSGLRLLVAPDFAAAYPDGVLTLSSIDGKLPYAYTETRTAWFPSGAVSLLLTTDGEVRTLMSREMEPREVLTVRLGAVASPGSGITGAEMHIAVDTSKVWHETTVTPGNGSAGESRDKALTILQAKASAGATGVWVYGYIVGGDLSSSGSKMNTGPTFESSTHLAIASRSSVTDKAACLSVELKKTDIRSTFNLKDHPEMLGRMIFLRGDIVGSYYGIPGVKNVTEVIAE